MSNEKYYRVEEIVQEVHDCRGIVQLVAEKLCVARATVLNYRRDHKEVKAAFKEEREKMIDIAEVKLYNALEEGEEWAVKLVLSRMGRDRGWGVLPPNALGSAIGSGVLILLPDNGRGDGPVVDGEAREVPALAEVQEGGDDA